MISSVLRGHGFDPSSQGRSSRAKAKPGKEARRVHSCAMGPTEDTARRSLAAARPSSGSTGRTQATARVPDAPVSRFTPTLDGGSKGLLENSDVCASTEHVNVQMTGQNGKTANQNPILETPCGKVHKRKAHRAARVHHNSRAI